MMRCSASEERGSEKKGRGEVGQRVRVRSVTAVVGGSWRMVMGNTGAGAALGGGIDQGK